MAVDLAPVGVSWAVLALLALLILAIFALRRRRVIATLRADDGARAQSLARTGRRWALWLWAAWSAAVTTPLFLWPVDALITSTYVLFFVLSGLGVYYITVRLAVGLEHRVVDAYWDPRSRARIAMYEPIVYWGGAGIGLAVASVLAMLGADLSASDQVILVAIGLLMGLPPMQLLQSMLGTMRPVSPEFDARLRARIPMSSSIPPLHEIDTRGAGLSLAFAIGLGERRSILMTGLESMPERELDAIILHELGHHELNHLRRRMLSMRLWPLLGVALLLAFGVANAFTVVVLMAVMQVCVLPFQYQHQEFEADRFAADVMGAPAPMADALTRLHQMNEVPESWGQESAAMSHPDLVARRAALESGSVPDRRWLDLLSGMVLGLVFLLAAVSLSVPSALGEYRNVWILVLFGWGAISGVRGGSTASSEEGGETAVQD